MILSKKKKKEWLIISILFSIFLISCETPSKPSFQLEQSFSIPLISEVSYVFLGSTGAIIDTTKSDFQDIFVVDPNGLVRLGVDIDFDIGSFDSALPDPSVNPFNIDASIDELLPDIQGSGKTDFQSITGLDPSLVPTGSPLPGASASGVPIPLDMNDFRRAETTGGTMKLTFRNELGFDIDLLEFFFESNGNQVGTTLAISEFIHGSTASGTVEFLDGEIIEIPLAVVVNVTWPSQTTKDEPGELVVLSIDNDDLKFRNARAVFPPQEISERFETLIDETEFSFSSQGDFVRINEGVISFSELKNSIDIDIDELIISFPTILTESSPGVYLPSDSLVVTLTGQNRIRRASHPSNNNGISFDISVNNIQVTAPDNKIVVHVAGRTEDTSIATPGDRSRTINEGDGITGEVTFNILDTGSARGLVQPRIINLNDTDDYLLDIMNPDVRIESNIEDIRSISERIQNLELVNPELSLHFTSNIGLETRIYGAIMGVNTNGEAVMLAGAPGTSFFVSPSDTISGLLRNGSPIPNSELVAINIAEASLNGSTQTITFSSDNTNIREFVSNLPVEIFFIGKGLLNPNSKTGSVATPIEIESNLSMDVPITLATRDGNPASFTDTLSVSLSDLPSDNDDNTITEAILRISYGNRIPIKFNVELNFLDEEDGFITRVPEAGDAPIRLFAAPVNQNGFSSGTEENVLVITLNEEQLNTLNKTEKLLITGQLLTSDNQSVSVRSIDTLRLGISASFKTRVRVD